jgi:hypothetical protein
LLATSQNGWHSKEKAQNIEVEGEFGHFAQVWGEVVNAGNGLCGGCVRSEAIGEIEEVRDAPEGDWVVHECWVGWMSDVSCQQDEVLGDICTYWLMMLDYMSRSCVYGSEDSFLDAIDDAECVGQKLSMILWSLSLCKAAR